MQHVAIVGAGIGVAGTATAAEPQAQGVSTLVSDCHDQPGRSVVPSEPECPSLASLGTDLLATTPLQRRLALSRPVIGLLAWALAAYAQVWWLTPVLAFLIFVAVVTVTRDIAHAG